MNILLINNLYGTDSVGGAEQVVRARAERWVSEGHSVFVLSSNKETKQQSNKDAKVQWFTLNIEGRCWYKELSEHSFFYRLTWHIKNMFDADTAREIVAFCRLYNIDKVETHNLIGISMQVPTQLCNAGIEHHHYLHDVQLVEPSGILPADHTRDSLAQRLYSLVVKRLFASPEVVFSPTKFLMDFYTSRGFFPESEWKVEFENMFISKHTNMQKVPREDGLRKYLFVGTLIEHKGVRQLLEAWNPTELATRYSLPVTLTIVGDGPLRSLVEAAAKEVETISYLGRVPHEELDEIYASHDVLVFPSQCIENRPNVIAEALAHGLEIIAVRTGGVEEMMEGYERVRFLNSLNLFL